MDKRKPTYRLEQVRDLAGQGHCKLTITAQQTADALGFSKTEVQHIIAQLTAQDFYKSVTEYRNTRIWQDVYKTRVNTVNVYIKLKVVGDSSQLLLILSFKEV